MFGVEQKWGSVQCGEIGKQARASLMGKGLGLPKQAVLGWVKHPHW